MTGANKNMPKVANKNVPKMGIEDFVKMGGGVIRK